MRETMLCAKITVIALCVKLTLLGLLLTAIGGFLLANDEAFSERSSIVISNSVLLTVGLVTLVTAIGGAVGAFREDKLLLSAFAVFTFLILVAEIALVIFGFIVAAPRSLSEHVSTVMIEEMPKYKWDCGAEGSEPCPPTNLIIDNLQQTFECCGGNDTAEWTALREENVSKNSIVYYPKSCCVLRPSLTGTFCEDINIFNQTCADALDEWTSENAILIWLIFAFIVVPLILVYILAIVLSCVLVRAIIRGGNSRNYQPGNNKGKPEYELVSQNAKTTAYANKQ